MCTNTRMRPRCALTTADDGTVVYVPVKSFWYMSAVLISLSQGWATISTSAVLTAASLTCLTLCLGHTIGLHRLLIHRSFCCPLCLERVLVTIGVLVGFAGPKKIAYMHDIRDWAQRQNTCHDFFIHNRHWLIDWFWNLHCELKLTHPPKFCPEDRITGSRYYRFLDRCWLMLQIPFALILYAFGGWAFVVWGIFVRVAVSLTGHWFIGYLAHNRGPREWHIESAAVQGYNVPGFGLLTFGEAWHNNHHAFPESARLGIESGQSDPGWWLLTILEGLGLVWSLKQPSDLPHRPELRRMTKAGDSETAIATFNRPTKTITKWAAHVPAESAELLPGPLLPPGNF